MKEKELENLAKFIFELGQLKKSPRSGWLKLGITNPESIADHSFRTAVIGLLIADIEGEDPFEVAGICLLHDLSESRTHDLDWLAQKYLPESDYFSSGVLEDQLRLLPEKPKTTIESLLLNRKERSEETLKLARDADVLDLLFQAQEYVLQGQVLAKEWFENTVSLLETESARQLGKFLDNHQREGSLEELLAWWRDIKVNEDRND